MTEFTVKCLVIACTQTAHDTKSRGNICVKETNAAFGTGRNYRKSEFRLVNFVRPINFLVFPSRHVGREVPRPSCDYSGLDLANQTKSIQKYLHFCFY